jgi:hypothetical protein
MNPNFMKNEININNKKLGMKTSASTRMTRCGQTFFNSAKEAPSSRAFSSSKNEGNGNACIKSGMELISRDKPQATL